MKKLLNSVLIATLSLGLFACSSKPSATTTVESFLKAMNSGDYTKCITYFDTDMADTFATTYDYVSSLNLADDAPITDETLSALSELVSTTLKSSCVSYAIGDTTKESDTKYTVATTIEYIDFDNTDTSTIEEKLVEQYQITDEMVEELDEDALGNLLLYNIAKYSTELMQYGLENGEKTSSDSTFTVEKVDNSWLITDIN